MDMAFFGEMAWKSALISGAALSLAYLLRSRAAADRALVLRLGVTMLLLLPFIAVALPALQIEAWAAPEPVALDTFYVPTPELQATATDALALEMPAPTIWDDPTPLILLAYLGGLLMVGGRLLAGLYMLGRWTRSAREVDCPEWLHAFDQSRWAAADGERVRLLVSDAVPSPLSWGWRNPVILIDPDTLADPDQAAAILAHEIAHVARRDWPVLMLTRVAATLFWFNPLVWLLEREVVQQAEEAADCEAAHCVEPTRYAQTLLSLAQVNGRLIPANSIAPSGSALSKRVRAILDRRLRERPSGSAWTGIAAVLCIGIAAPVAAMQLVEAARAPEAPQPPEAPRAPGAPLAPTAPRAPLAPLAPTAPGTPEALVAPHTPPAPGDVPDVPEIPDVGPIVEEALASVLPQIPQMVASAMASVDPVIVNRATAAALAEARVEMRHLSRAEHARIQAEIRRSVAEARAQIDAARPQIAIAMRNAEHARAAGMAHGARGMMTGADNMEAGARRMEEEARRLQDRDYRERQIARARARGESVTHEQLIEAAEGMRDGAEGMREGARELRHSAERMRGGDEG
jgi:beta-lactamase regulating signal transducer with metallopeptidase domain